MQEILWVNFVSYMSGVCSIRMFYIFSSHALLAFACIGVVHVLEYTQCSIHLQYAGLGQIISYRGSYFIIN